MAPSTRDRRAPQPARVRQFAPAAPGRGAVLMVHPGSMPASSYQALAAALPGGVGLVVVDLDALSGPAAGGQAAPSVAQLADRLAEAVREDAGELVPAGAPWVLAGWSFGGIVGYAAVARLGAAARPAGLLVLDSYAPVAPFNQPPDAFTDAMLLSWFAQYVGAWRDRPLHLPPGALDGRGVDDGLPLVLSAGLDQDILRPGTSVHGLRKLYDTYVRIFLGATGRTHAYAPDAAGCPVTVVRAREGLLGTVEATADRAESTLGWSRLAPGAQCHVSPGNHYSMLRDPAAAQVIAAAAARLLAGAGQEATAAGARPRQPENSHA